MTVAKIVAATVWLEPPAPVDALPISAFLQESGGEYVLATTGTQDASLVDWHGDGAEFEMLITSAPLVVIDNAGVLELATSGTPAAILVDDNGDLVLSTDLTQTPAGAFYVAANGDYVAARFDAPRARIVKTDTNYAVIT